MKQRFAVALQVLTWGNCSVLMHDADAFLRCAGKPLSKRLLQPARGEQCVMW